MSNRMNEGRCPAPPIILQNQRQPPATRSTGPADGQPSYGGGGGVLPEVAATIIVTRSRFRSSGFS